MSYLPATTFTYHSSEPPVNTTILIHMAGWGVAYTRDTDGLWYTNAGDSLVWEELLEYVVAEEVYVLGPDNYPEED